MAVLNLGKENRKRERKPRHCKSDAAHCEGVDEHSRNVRPCRRIFKQICKPLKSHELIHRQVLSGNVIEERVAPAPKRQIREQENQNDERRHHKEKAELRRHCVSVFLGCLWQFEEIRRAKQNAHAQKCEKYISPDGLERLNLVNVSRIREARLLEFQENQTRKSDKPADAQNLCAEALELDIAERHRASDRHTYHTDKRGQRTDEGSYQNTLLNVALVDCALETRRNSVVGNSRCEERVVFLDKFTHTGWVQRRDKQANQRKHYNYSQEIADNINRLFWLPQ